MKRTNTTSEIREYTTNVDKPIVISRTLKKQRRKARFLHMIFTIMQQGAATRFTAGKSQT